MLYTDIISKRLQYYKIQTLEDEENALKEIMQEVALYALSTTKFFDNALFQGGTSLRILYQLPRFSEDLDFILKQPEMNFKWNSYIDKIMDAFELFGIEPEITDRSQADKAVQKLFLKDNSIGKIINLKFSSNPQRKLLIKLEIDTNPPLGSNEEIKYLDFPTDCVIMAQDIASNFAGKCHALLCRQYVKGRDWFDFSWYVSQKATINMDFLSAAINQAGPWAGQNILVTSDWLVEQLADKISSIDWVKTREDVARFVNFSHQESLALWSNNFFKNKLQKLEEYFLSPKL